MIHRKSLAEFEACYENDDCGEIGRGSFGTVFKASRRDYPGEFVAVKQVYKETSAEKLLEAMQNEVEIMERIVHPRIVRTYEVIDTPLQLMFVMEYCNGGEFLAQVKRTQEPFGEKDTARMALDVLGALRFLHFKGICHRDLKPENLLRDYLGGVKVADFGVANTFKATHWLKKAMHGLCGSPGYWAPEVCNGGEYSEKCDVWSLGIITFYALSGGRVPFPQTDSNELGTATDESDVTRLEIPSQWSADSKAWIKELLTFKLADRPAAAQAMELHFVKSLLGPPPEMAILPEDLAMEFCHFAKAPLLTRTLGIVAARHLHISRVPDIGTLRNTFDILDQGRHGYVYVTTILQAIKCSVMEFGISPELFQERFETFGRSTGSIPGCVEFSVFLATKAVFHVHSMKAAFHMIKDTPEGITIRALQDLVLRQSIEEFQALPAFPGRRVDDVVTLQQLLALLNFETDEENRDRGYKSIAPVGSSGKYSNDVVSMSATYGSLHQATGCLCCKRRSQS